MIKKDQYEIFLTNEQRLQMMDLANQAGLPIEAFLRTLFKTQIKSWNRFRHSRLYQFYKMAQNKLARY